MIAINKHSAKLKIWNVKLPNAAYLERFGGHKKPNEDYQEL